MCNDVRNSDKKINIPMQSKQLLDLCFLFIFLLWWCDDDDFDSVNKKRLYGSTNNEWTRFRDKILKQSKKKIFVFIVKTKARKSWLDFSWNRNQNNACKYHAFWTCHKTFVYSSSKHILAKIHAKSSRRFKKKPKWETKTTATSRLHSSHTQHSDISRLNFALNSDLFQKIQSAFCSFDFNIGEMGKLSFEFLLALSHWTLTRTHTISVNSCSICSWR